MSTITLLAAVNTALTLSRQISADFSSLTDSAQQPLIDIAVEIWRSAMQELYSKAILPKETSQGSFTLSTAIRDYNVPSDLERIATPRIVSDDGENHTIEPYKGGFVQMFQDQPTLSDATGFPRFWAWNTNSRRLHIDTDPTSSEAGTKYKYLYEKRLTLSAAADTFPFSDTVVESLYEAVTQGIRDKMNQQFNATLFRGSVVKAALYLRDDAPQKTWGRIHA